MTDLELQIQIIEKLVHDEDSEVVTCYRDLEQLTGETKKRIKLVIDNLKGLGMIELVPAWDMDGEFLRGSGYMLTTRATQWSIREWLTKCKEIQDKK